MNFGETTIVARVIEPVDEDRVRIRLLLDECRSMFNAYSGDYLMTAYGTGVRLNSLIGKVVTVTGNWSGFTFWKESAPETHFGFFAHEIKGEPKELECQKSE